MNSQYLYPVVKRRLTMDKSFMITHSENSAIVSVRNYDLSEQIDHLSALIKDMKEKNAEYFNDGFHKNVKIS